MSDQNKPSTSSIEDSLAKEPEDVKKEAIFAKEHEDVGLSLAENKLQEIEDKFAETIKETLGTK